jgi:hypothetical protein
MQQATSHPRTTCWSHQGGQRRVTAAHSTSAAVIKMVHMRESHRESATCIECTRAGQKQAQGHDQKHSYNTHCWTLLCAIHTQVLTLETAHTHPHANTHSTVLLLHSFATLSLAGKGGTGRHTAVPEHSCMSARSDRSKGPQGQQGACTSHSHSNTLKTLCKNGGARGAPGAQQGRAASDAVTTTQRKLCWPAPGQHKVQQCCCTSTTKDPPTTGRTPLPQHRHSQGQQARTDTEAPQTHVPEAAYSRRHIAPFPNHHTLSTHC